MGLLADRQAADVCTALLQHARLTEVLPTARLTLLLNLACVETSLS